MLELLQTKLPFALKPAFLSEQVNSCLNLCYADAQLSLLHKGKLQAYGSSEVLDLASAPDLFQRFNPPRVELKTKSKPRYPFPGQIHSVTFDWTELAALCEAAGLEHKLFLLVDEQVPGNTIFNLQPPKQSEWQISCLNLSTNSHCVYFDINLPQAAHLQIDCLSITNVHTAAELQDALAKTTQAPSNKPLRAEQGLIIYADVAKDAKLTSTSCNFKSSSLNDAVIHLNEDGAEAEAYAAMFVNNKDSQSTHLEIRHHAPHTTSFMLCNGVVQAKCSGEFVGRGYIDKAAHGTNCRQESRFLTLDKTAKAKTYPLLIIDEYDVVAGHATSVGQLNPEALYYMQSRGLTADLAKKLMTRGFLIPVVDHFQSPLLQKLGVKLLEWQTNYTANSEAELSEHEQWTNLAADSNQLVIDIDEDKILSSKDVQ